MLFYGVGMGIVGGRRRTVGRMVMAACVGSLLLGAAGCTAPSTPTPTSNPPTVAPIFASDEEALAAATSAYTDYLSVAGTIAHEGGVDAQRMSDVAVDEAFDTEIEALTGMADAGTVGVGEVRFDSFELQSVDSASGAISAYVCLDVSESDVINHSGESVVPSDRAKRLPLEVGFVYDRDLQRLLLGRTEIWDGEDFC